MPSDDIIQARPVAAGAVASTIVGIRALPRQARHDLRSSIGLIIGYSELWLDELEEEGGLRGVEDLRRDLLRLQSAGRQILDLVNAHIDPIPLQERTGHHPAVPTDANHRDAASPEPPGESVAATQLRHVSSSTANEPSQNPSSSRLLLVNDSEAASRLQQRLQGAVGVMFVAHNGQEALSVLAAESIDVVLLALTAPDIDGMEILRTLKDRESLRHIPVIVTAARDSDGVLECLEHGADDYAAEPLEPALLHVRISNCLDKKRLRDREAELMELVRNQHQRMRQLESLYVDLEHRIVRDVRTPLTSLLVHLHQLACSTTIAEADRELMSDSIAVGETLLGTIDGWLAGNSVADSSQQRASPVPYASSRIGCSNSCP